MIVPPSAASENRWVWIHCAYGPFNCSSTKTSGGYHREISVRHVIGTPFSVIR